jgi:hypothetical protein
METKRNFIIEGYPDIAQHDAEGVAESRRPQWRDLYLLLELSPLAADETVEVAWPTWGNVATSKIIRKTEAEVPNRSPPYQVRHERHSTAPRVASACSKGPTQVAV